MSSTTLINPADESVIGEIEHTSLEATDEAIVEWAWRQRLEPGPTERISDS